MENTDFAASVEVNNVLTVPVSADDQLKEERRSCRIHEAYLQRSSETTQIVLHTSQLLGKRQPRRFVNEFDNTAKDHRIVW